MFDVDAFIEDCLACMVEADPRRALRETVARAVSDPGAVTEALPPRRAGLEFLHRADDLTILHVVWAPGMRLFPHDHRMWACIGIHSGREDNEFFRRGDDVGHLVESGGKRLDTGDVTLLGDDTVHAVSNPLRAATGAIHVYGGDFIARPRSQWPEPGGPEEPYDPDIVTRVFAEANEQWAT